MNFVKDARVKLRSLLLTALIRVIDGEQFAAVQVQLPAKQNELAKDRAKGLVVVAAEIGNGLEVWLQMPQQPDHLDVAVGFCFEPAARPNPVEVAVDVEFEEILGGIARPAGRLGRDPDEPSRRQIQPLNESVDEADRVG